VKLYPYNASKPPARQNARLPGRVTARTRMDIRRCYQILDVPPHATQSQIKQAYLDLVHVWHPDRFGTNPRLRQKAQEKMKLANLAYETIRQATPSGPGAEGCGSVSRPRPSVRNAPSRTEALAEAGTRAVLSLFSILRAVVQDAMHTPSQGRRKAETDGKGNGP